MLPIPFPTSGISLDFGAYDNKNYFPTSPHMGTDWSSYRLGKRYGLPILASGPGVCVFNGFSSTSTPRQGRPSKAHGFSVAIEYDEGVTVHYSHRRAANGPETGRRVELGTFLGNVGNTGLSSGEHLHMETWRNNIRLSPHRFFDFTRTVGAMLASSGAETWVPPVLIDYALLRRQKESVMYVKGKTLDPKSIYCVYTDVNGSPKLRLCGAFEAAAAVSGGLVIECDDETLTGLGVEARYQEVPRTVAEQVWWDTTVDRSTPDAEQHVPALQELANLGNAVAGITSAGVDVAAVAQAAGDAAKQGTREAVKGLTWVAQ